MNDRHLLIIDPQLDFCDGPAAALGGGALPVAGAWEDLSRLAGFVQEAGERLDAITVTLDSHHAYDIGHPGWWRDAAGGPPPPFTLIGPDDLARGTWRCFDPDRQAASLAYLEALARGGRYVHTVWPVHCRLGTRGHALHPDLAAALAAWEVRRGRLVTYVLKGLNPTTEHYSAIRAEVPDPSDPATLPNGALLDALAGSSELLVAGEALSHCVKATIEDAVALRPQLAPRMVLLADAMSPVAAIPGGPDFPAFGRAFLADVQAQGARVATLAEVAGRRPA